MTPGRRVRVVGGPGSGKTTYARALAADLGVPHHDLDRIAWAPPPGEPGAPFRRWLRVPDGRRRERAAAIAAGDGWVADGLYAGWTEPLRDAADRIVWLDPPARVAVVRVLRRALADRGRDWDLRSVWRVARSARSFRTRPAGTAADLLARDGANSSRTLEVFLHPVRDKVERTGAGLSRRRP